MASMSEAVFSNDNSQLNDRPMSAGGSTVDYDERGLSDISQPPVSYVAPALRVEELKDELVDDAVSGSSICGSSIAGSSICGTDDEFAVSAGDASDQVNTFIAG
jgi:hypothetical protein